MKLKHLAAILTLAIGLAIIPTTAPADAATWGQSSNVYYSGGRWHGTVDDTKTDGYCVSLWTIDPRGRRQSLIARSCGTPATGSAYGGRWEDERGVRMYRDDGRYQTIVWPGATP